MKVISVSNENFQSNVLASDKLALVDFYADWCGPCKMMAPVMEALAVKYGGQLGVFKANVDNMTDVAAQYGIASIPAFLFFKNGQVVANVVGALPQEALEAKIQTLLDQI